MANHFCCSWSLPCFLPFLFLLPCVNSIHFKISRFDPEATNIVYEGDARPYVGAVDFNSVSYLCRVGRVSYAQSVPIWDSGTNKVADFTTHFSFFIDTLNRNISMYAAGLAFFLAPVGFEIPPNSAGGFLGLFNTTTSDSTRNQIVLVEFDTFPNPEWDPPVQHVGINTNSISSAEYTPWNFSLYSGKTADAWISYNATTKNLSVTWNYQATTISQHNFSLSHHIDLKQILPERVKIGFSAATSHFQEGHRLLFWEFSSSLEIKETKGKKTKNVKLIAVLAVLLGILVTVVSVLFVFFRRWKKMKEEREERTNLTSINDDLERGAGPRRFSYTDLVVATNNFSNQRKLGEGGFGAVYKGYFNDIDTAVAVKKIAKGSRQGKKEYITEIKIISRLRHRNLVQLIGWCHDGVEFLLVYEFMSNGSLDSHLFGKKTPISWPFRYKIARGLASALLYLHEEWEQCVVHRDIKSSNVMLDSSFNVKLGDFGLARLMDHELGPLTTGLAGTLGYMAPEYIRTGRASKASDVYSFGIVALEIAAGRKSVDPIEENSQRGLVEWVWHLYGTGNLISAVDQRLHADFDEKQIECLMIVGLWCAHPDSNLRPSIRQAIQVLDFDVALPNLPVKMPVPTYHQPIASSGSNEPLMTDSNLEVGP
ncbi:Protein kinase domain - like 10 [Theobroma cacao]|uniref:L-type lectin-domain containing receptor kinase IX.1 n=1 Tax=Theobroma cacao TaxID=3641 RepID=A0AB32WDN3_THECC|nr:PREDICTED: L-type lectin-domain containing receptor kinase IX.1 [Theobroma cacao]WRX08039.1 Protein kinase domain - like 10 [Theobroma cacao]